MDHAAFLSNDVDRLPERWCVLACQMKTIAKAAQPERLIINAHRVPPR